jgi:hypothetical protein
LEADLVVTGLVAEPSRNREIAEGDAGVELHLGPHDELVVEDGKRFGFALEGEVRRLGINQIGDANASRHFDREHGRDERRVAWAVGLNVELLGQRHRQRQPDRASRHRVGFDKRRDGGARRLSHRRRGERKHRETSQKANGAPAKVTVHGFTAHQFTVR